jgi:sugar phosphate isomerase/epimerase
MRFALSSGSLYTYGLDRLFALAAEAGFDGVEVVVDARFDSRQPDHLRRLVERYELPILSLHAPFYPERLVSWPSTQPRSIAATAKLARALGAGVVVAHLPRRKERAYARWLRDDFREWQQDHPDPVIAVENMPLVWSRRWPFGPREGWRMNRLEQWGSFPHLNLDTTHLGTKGLDPEAVYERVRDRMVHVHLSNARRAGRRVREHCRLEDGFLRLDLFLQRLARDGFGGIVTVELWPSVLGPADEKRVLRHLRRQIAFCRQHGEARPVGVDERGGQN